MPPLPKRKIAGARRGERRSHLALEPITMTLCTNCREMRLPHHVCPHCGFYRGRQVITVGGKPAKT